MGWTSTAGSSARLATRLRMAPPRTGLDVRFCSALILVTGMDPYACAADALSAACYAERCNALQSSTRARAAASLEAHLRAQLSCFFLCGGGARAHPSRFTLRFREDGLKLRAVAWPG